MYKGENFNWDYDFLRLRLPMHVHEYATFATATTAAASIQNCEEFPLKLCPCSLRKTTKMNKGVKADEEITWLKVTRYIFTYLPNNLAKEREKNQVWLKIVVLWVECYFIKRESEFISSHQYLNGPDISLNFNHCSQLKWHI